MHTFQQDSLYALSQDELTLSIRCGKKYPAPEINRQNHRSETTRCKKIQVFNRGVRHEGSLLITGDLPLFAFASTHPDNAIDPPFLIFGDMYIRFCHQGQELFFHDFDEITASFHPFATEWIGTSEKLPGLQVRLNVSIFDGSAICGSLSVEALEKTAVLPKAELSFGGLKLGTRPLDPCFIQPDSAEIPSQATQLSEGHFLLAPALENSPFSTEKVYVNFANGFGKAQIQKGRIQFSFNSAEESTADFLIFHSLDNMPEKAALPLSACKKDFTQMEQYADQLLQSCRVSTPSPLLNAAIRHSILNLDYIHIQDAWFEGGHWWNCYWTNNFQISAAIALGQYEYAKKALLFFGLLDEGYSCTTAAGKNANEEVYPHTKKRTLHFEGIPYYLYELWQYTEATGDLSVIETVYDRLTPIIDDLFSACDINQTGLIGWRYGCNAFLYQADHLQLPGDAVSPSVMLAAMLDKLAYLAKLIGKQEDAAVFSKRSDEMKSAVKQKLWNEEAGYFYSHLDLQGIRHSAHYYTDLIFPALYGNFEEKYSLGGLKHLKETLLFRSAETGELLMRVGDLKPDIFGNNNVMPTQMAETARAFCKIGDKNLALSLMHAAARGATVFTESPGSSPERLNDEGKGECNYLFGNPCASFLYTAVSGIFGIRVQKAGTELCLSPSLDDRWPQAAISLPFAEYTVCGKTLSVLVKDEKIQTLRLVFYSDDSNVQFSVNDTILCGQAEQTFGRRSITLTLSVRTGSTIQITPLFDCGAAENPPCEFPTGVPSKQMPPILTPIDQGISIDISQNINSDHMTALSAWRRDSAYYIPWTALSSVPGYLLTPAGKFASAPTAKDNRIPLCVIDRGFSHELSGAPLPTEFPSNQTFIVNDRIRRLDLFYVTEAASRLTGSTVGKLILNYDHFQQILPLTVGKNISSLFHHFAKEAIAVKLHTSEATDSASVLQISCDSQHLLQSFTIAIDLFDAEFALIGANKIL